MVKKIICELCKREIPKEQVAYNGAFVLCEKCKRYLFKKGRSNK